MPNKLVGVGFLFAAAALIEPAAAARAAGLLCSGVWKSNEQLTHRTRTPIAPTIQFFEPWGNNGWMRMNMAGFDSQGAELVFNSFNGNVFRVYGSDPREQTARQIDDYTFETTSVRNGKPADKSIVQYSKDCKRLTFTVPEGTDRRTGLKYYNDVRVYDEIAPPGGAAPAAAEIFGGWMLNREASKLTLPPMSAETVIVVPWGKSGWAWNQISGAYQPEDMLKKVTTVEVDGPAANSVPHSNTMLYLASWDSKTFPTYGRNARDVRLKRITDRTFEATFFKNSQAAAEEETATVAFSPDGRRLTVTTKSSATTGPNHFEDDVRVYDRIDPTNWPSRAP